MARNFERTCASWHGYRLISLRAGMGKTSRSSLPYGIPGPAGDTCSLFSPARGLGVPQRGSVVSDAPQRFDVRLYATGPWQAMLAAEKLQLYGEYRMCDSIGSFKKSTPVEGKGKLNRISARV